MGVPGEVRGFHAAWKKYGKLPWKDLVQPSIDLAAEGFQLGNSAYYALNRKSVQPLLKNDPGMRYFIRLSRPFVRCVDAYVSRRRIGANNE